MKEKIIIRCAFCKQKIRLPIISQTLNVTCPNNLCRRNFTFNYKKYKINNTLNLIFTFILAFLLLGCGILIRSKWNHYLNKRQALSVKEKVLQNDVIKRISGKYEVMIDSLKVQYQKELQNIDKSNLKLIAENYYKKIWESRLNYDAEYAMSPREQVLLTMKKLSNTNNKKVKDIINDIAIMASPKNSKINIIDSKHGLILDIDFDMSELTKGEFGSSTKHTTIASLKKETITLISQVTNDIFMFCGDLGIESIQVGCMHYVKQYLNKIYQNDHNIIIYKIKLDKSDLDNLDNNPFIDFFSTAEKLNVLVDDFPNLDIEINS